MVTDRLLNTNEAAAYLGMSPITLKIYRVRGDGPTYRKLGRSVRYTAEDLAAFVEAGKRTSTSQAA